MTRPTIGGPLDLGALSRLHRVTPAKPETVCRPCWVTWHASRVPSPIGYCWHQGIAWRVKPSGEVTTTAATRDEHAAMCRLVERRP